MTAKTEAPAGGGSGERQETAHSGQTARSETSTNRSLTEAAQAYARLGYVPVPLNKDRRPILRGWPDAEAGEDAARDRFERCAAHGIALLTCGFLVLDLDRNHTSGVDGIANFAELVAKHGDFPRHGPRGRSRRGGMHVYMAGPVGVALSSSVSKIAPGVDVKAGLALTTCPPTPGYRWIKQLCPVADIPPAPGWLIQLIKPPPPVSRPIACLRIWSGVRSPYAEAALEREVATIANAPPGVRNAALFAGSARLGGLAAGGYLQIDQVTDALLWAAAASGLTQDDGLHSVRSTIASGLRAGLKRPRSAPERSNFRGGRNGRS